MSLEREAGEGQEKENEEEEGATPPHLTVTQPVLTDISVPGAGRLSCRQLEQEEEEEEESLIKTKCAVH